MQKEEILNADPRTLGLSAGFCHRLEQMGFESIQEVLNVPPAALVGLEGFSYHWLAELSSFLEMHGLAGLLQKMPGKNHGQYGSSS